jgi:hypothetical protein
VQRLGNLEHLLFGHAQLTHPTVDVDVESKASQEIPRFALRGLPVDYAFAGVSPEHQVFRHCEVREQIQLLVDRGNPQGFRVLGAVDLHRHAVHRHLTRVGLVRSGKDADQSGLPGTVLANKGQNLAWMELKTDVLEGLYAQEVLGQIFDG